MALYLKTLLNFFAVGFILFSQNLYSGQFGLPMPSHRFPTDTSFHASYLFGLGSTTSNYSGAGTQTSLSDWETVSFQKNTVQLEFQPSNHFNIGVNLAFLRMALNPINEVENSVSRWSAGDQTFFAEYRFLDGPGYSLGLSGLLKFPAYQNETQEEALAKGYALLPGDAQTDFGGMLSAEIWPTSTLRVQGDFGYLFRTQDFAEQLIYMGTVGFVIPKIDITFRMLGYHSVGAGPTPGSAFETEITEVQRAFASSNYSYSPMASLLMMSPKVEFWFSPEYSVVATYTKTMMGTSSANGGMFELGFMYRFTERKQNIKRNYTDVDIDYDQNSGVFEGELQEKRQRQNKETPRQDFEFEPLYFETPEE